MCLILAAELKSPRPGESQSPFRRVVILPAKAGDAVMAQLLITFVLDFNPRHAGASGGFAAKIKHFLCR